MATTMTTEAAAPSGPGFFLRPWLRFTLEEALAGIAASGARLVGYQPQPGRSEISVEASPGQIEGVRGLFAAYDLTLVLYRPRVGFNLPDDEFVAAFEREFDLADRLGVKLLMFGGPGRPAEYDAFWHLMPLAAAAAERRGFTIALKPHGGLLGTAADCLNVVRLIDHPAVRIAYDPGNVIYDTGADPLDGLPALAPFVSALCVKDSTGPASEGGTVMIRPGQGRVDFARLFAILRDGGFDGPSLVETLAEGTLEEVNRQAKKTLDYLRMIAG